ncbi:nuclear pore complex-interacting protein family member B12-like [Podarcis raffonei]|uniref:nuclear pore complex-interacting protein family member B12-like n=1 Tax=Podarcis raffonei TaxID=65483 RepID=UPI0023294F91|nr:nuclear pore complex-interacting protein family member B12-like [Podarcis raffonei]
MAKCPNFFLHLTMPDTQESDQFHPVEASTVSAPGLPVYYPNLPFGASMQRSAFGRYNLWEMIQQIRFLGPQVPRVPDRQIRRPRMRGGMIRQQMPLMGQPHVMQGGAMGEPQAPLINFQGRGGREAPRGPQRRGMGRRGMGRQGMGRRGMGRRGMEAPGIAPRGMAPPQGIEPQRRREPKRKKSKDEKNQGVEPREREEEDMEPPRDMKRRRRRSQEREPPSNNA